MAPRRANDICGSVENDNWLCQCGDEVAQIEKDGEPSLQCPKKQQRCPFFLWRIDEEPERRKITRQSSLKSSNDPPASVQSRPSLQPTAQHKTVLTGTKMKENGAAFLANEFVENQSVQGDMQKSFHSHSESTVTYNVTNYGHPGYHSAPEYRSPEDIYRNGGLPSPERNLHPAQHQQPPYPTPPSEHPSPMQGQGQHPTSAQQQHMPSENRPYTQQYPSHYSLVPVYDPQRWDNLVEISAVAPPPAWYAIERIAAPVPPHNWLNIYNVATPVPPPHIIQTNMRYSTLLHVAALVPQMHTPQSPPSSHPSPTPNLPLPSHPLIAPISLPPGPSMTEATPNPLPTPATQPVTNLSYSSSGESWASFGALFCCCRGIKKRQH